MSLPIVQCSGMTKRYGDVLAVDSLSFTLEPGEVLSMLGPSGCGKTTMLRLIAGFERPDAGEVRIQGRVVSGSSGEVPPEARNVGMVFQEYALFPHMTVAQNVAFGLQGLPTRERRRRVAEVIDLARLTGLEGRYPHELSGGQQQRAALARTLAPRPVAVLLDEPFSNLDSGMRRRMRQEVESILRQHRISTVFVTHDREEAFAMADRLGVMRDGRLEQLATPEVVYHRPATRFVAEMAGTCDFLKGELRNGIADTEVGPLPVALDGGPPPECVPVEVMVRPDDFRAEPDPQGRFVVRSREFRGDALMLVIGATSGATLRCRALPYSALGPGARVALAPARGLPFVGFRAIADGGAGLGVQPQAEQ